MSLQKGNTSRTRSQKHQNSKVFKNDLHDTSHKIKVINSLDVNNVCERCKGILEWKIKYKKYKPLSAPKTCTKCGQKTIKHAYHTLCLPCANEQHICPKCGKERITMDLLNGAPCDGTLNLDKEMLQTVKTLSERKRRTFMRFFKAKQKQDGISSSVNLKAELQDKLAALKLECASSEKYFDEEDSIEDFESSDDEVHNAD